MSHTERQQITTSGHLFLFTIHILCFCVYKYSHNFLSCWQREYEIFFINFSYSLLIWLSPSLFSFFFKIEFPCKSLTHSNYPKFDFFSLSLCVILSVSLSLSLSVCWFVFVWFSMQEIKEPDSFASWNPVISFFQIFCWIIQITKKNFSQNEI